MVKFVKISGDDIEYSDWNVLELWGDVEVVK